MRTCVQYIDVGVYNPNDGCVSTLDIYRDDKHSIVLRFLFITESEEFTAELFSDPYVQKHSKVAAVRKVFGPEEHFINFGYNFFQPGHVIPTFVWSPMKNMKNRNQIFTPMEDFQGFQFDVKNNARKI